MNKTESTARKDCFAYGVNHKGHEQCGALLKLYCKLEGHCGWYKPAGDAPDNKFVRVRELAERIARERGV